MKQAFLLTFITLAFHKAMAGENNNLHVERPEKIEIHTTVGLIVKAAIVGEGVEIEVLRGGAVLKVPLAETIGLKISLSACEITASEAKNAVEPPEVVEVVLPYGKPHDDFEEGTQAFGTVAFRFLKGRYLERTRDDIETKATKRYRKPVEKPEVEVIHDSEQKVPHRNPIAGDQAAPSGGDKSSD